MDIVNQASSMSETDLTKTITHRAQLEYERRLLAVEGIKNTRVDLLSL